MNSRTDESLYTLRSAPSGVGINPKTVKFIYGMMMCFAVIIRLYLLIAAGLVLYTMWAYYQLGRLSVGIPLIFVWVIIFSVVYGLLKGLFYLIMWASVKIFIR